MWDRTGENQVYVRQQKAAEEQLRFDKTEKPSCLASKDTGGRVPQCPPRICNLVGILLVDKTANVSIDASSYATKCEADCLGGNCCGQQRSGPRGLWSGFCPT